jgi:TRAP-type C4-dicarboxylate transport system permease small subunit
MGEVESVMSRDAERSGASIGQVLVIVGLLLLYGVGAYWMCAELVFGDSGGGGEKQPPWWLKVGLPAVVVGMTILFVTVLFQRLKAAKTDKYTDVKD